MKHLTILTSAACSHCVAAKSLLLKHRIDYQEVDLIKGGEQAQTLLKQSGQRTVPQIFINKEPIGGFTELAQLLSNKEFDINQLPQL